MGTAHAEKNEAAEKDETAFRQLHAPATPTILQTQFYHFSWFPLPWCIHSLMKDHPFLRGEEVSSRRGQKKRTKKTKIYSFPV
jgi:hypothetical protein